ncbi:hypothetical protein SAMN06272771_6366 [Streptomyces sp. Ag82_O1-12]|nr:hypothetical protein SAMN06272771_6366 [Streptomyces sp. Ag82_O1-12]SOD48914.1 hypothetical protein SAMN06272727_6370 [Streptomyces sp. Ag82_G6-1]
MSVPHSTTGSGPTLDSVRSSVRMRVTGHPARFGLGLRHTVYPSESWNFAPARMPGAVITARRSHRRG